MLACDFLEGRGATSVTTVSSAPSRAPVAHRCLPGPQLLNAWKATLSTNGFLSLKREVERIESEN